MLLEFALLPGDNRRLCELSIRRVVAAILASAVAALMAIARRAN
jgi:hypothetical protein